jgi:hypothetical protein
VKNVLTFDVDRGRTILLFYALLLRGLMRFRDLFLLMVVAAPFLAFLWQAIYTPGSA